MLSLTRFGKQAAISAAFGLATAAAQVIVMWTFLKAVEGMGDGSLGAMVIGWAIALLLPFVLAASAGLAAGLLTGREYLIPKAILASPMPGLLLIVVISPFSDDEVRMEQFFVVFLMSVPMCLCAFGGLWLGSRGQRHRKPLVCAHCGRVFQAGTSKQCPVCGMPAGTAVSRDAGGEQAEMVPGQRIEHPPMVPRGQPRDSGHPRPREGHSEGHQG